MAEVRFVDELPPIKKQERPGGSRYRQNDQLRQALINNPGKWAIYGEYSKTPSNIAGSTAYQINQRWEGFEARTRTDDDGNVSVYVRYNPAKGLADERGIEVRG